jgi:hypothetical protein
MTAYQPKWLRLDEARGRLVLSASMDELGAEAWLIRAIQDQLRADPEGYAAQTMFRVQGFPTQWTRRRFPRDWPARLTPDRVDWQASTIRGLHPVTLMETDLFIEVSAATLGTGQQAAPDPARNGSGVRTTRHASAEEACGAWIRSLAEEPRQRKADVKEAALAKHQGLSENAFDRQWALNTPAAWRIQGRF